MSELLKKIDYALRKDSLTDAERVSSARQLVSQALNDPAPSPDGCGAALTVKPLVWEESDGSLTGQKLWSSGDPWVFWIVKNPDSRFIWCENFNIDGFVPASPVRGSYDSVDEAKAAAQADFDKRVRDAIEVPQSAAMTDAPSDWQEDPSADERWNAGLDYGMVQLCAVLGVDPHMVTWDAATETLDGDVCAAIGNIFREKYGDDFDPTAPLPQPTATSAEPVAWQYRYRLSQAWADLGRIQINDYRSAYREEIARGDILLRPLYATPPSSGNADVVRENLAKKITAHVGRLASVPMNLPLSEWNVISNNILDAAAALSSAPVAGEWKDISTAEPDTTLLVANPDEGTLPVIAWRIEDTWYPYDLSKRDPLNPQPTIWTDWPKMPRSIPRKDGGAPC